MKSCCATVAAPDEGVSGAFPGAPAQSARRLADPRRQMAPRQSRTRGRILLLAALVAVWIAVVTIVWRRAPVTEVPGQPTPAAGRAGASEPSRPASAVAPPGAAPAAGAK